MSICGKGKDEGFSILHRTNGTDQVNSILILASERQCSKLSETVFGKAFLQVW